MRDAAGHPVIMVTWCVAFMLFALWLMSYLDHMSLIAELGNGQ